VRDGAWIDVGKTMTSRVQIETLERAVRVEAEFDARPLSGVATVSSRQKHRSTYRMGHITR
jgi:hypothetical protein